ncbi:DUF2997 domain-containing protein (plasmid) [Nostoc sp. C052]|uniref:DUF2997 domain-containing protein n=1 Tax=Nostoc sp. C052 TaxID=2576902 RepID=UPI0015C33624|nr:DUF2997 domain-containing protein [Nostoc sp. C052]QLE46457.1 DUF2997 domain-containing protein [Nostoc sp. C052]
MSHISHIKVGLKSKELIESALKRFELFATEVEGRLHVDGNQFGVPKYYLDFVYSENAQEYEIVTDTWALNLYESTLPKNFIKEFTLEYTKQMVQAEGQKLGLNASEWESDGKGSLRIVLASSTAQMNVQIAANNIVSVSVAGMIGASCQQFSAQLENALGAIQTTQLTAEFYAGQEEAMAQQQITTGW